MVPKNSLQCSQEPTTVPSHDPDESSPHPTFYLAKNNFNIFSQLCLYLPNTLLSLGFPTKIL